MDYLSDIYDKAKTNKLFALTGVFFSLLLSCVIIVVVVNIEHKNTILDKKVEINTLNDKPSYNTDCCVLVENQSVNTTEYIYNNTDIILSYTITLAFIILSLCGTFKVLLKTLRTENEINSKILDAEITLHIEKEMRGETNQKKEP